MTIPMQWLMEGPAWVQYGVQACLSEDKGGANLENLRAAMLQEEGIQTLVAELQAWPGPPLTSHKSAGHPLHKLVFLADLGLTVHDPGIQPIADAILSQVSAQGPFRVVMNIPAHFGGSGEDQLAWALCDAPLTLYALARFGLKEHPAVRKAADFLAGLVRDNGWPCGVSPEMGKFRGPGRKDDPCPFANLIMLQALAQVPGYQNHPAVQAGIEAILTAWAERRQRHPYMFYMGTDFCKLKAPLVWYDILHVLDVLTHFPQARGDERLEEMLRVVRSKANQQGRFTPESIWTTWKDWEFGQKKAPSRWVTWLVYRVFERAQVI